MERCPSGLRSWSWKPVIPKGTVGSNPTFSVCIFEKNRYTDLKFRLQLGEVPKWLKGLPWKGSRSLIAARGFKSLLLRRSSQKNKNTAWQTKKLCGKIIELTKQVTTKHIDNWTVKQPWKFKNRTKSGKEISWETRMRIRVDQRTVSRDTT